MIGSSSMISIQEGNRKRKISSADDIDHTTSMRTSRSTCTTTTLIHSTSENELDDILLMTPSWRSNDIITSSSIENNDDSNFFDTAQKLERKKFKGVRSSSKKTPLVLSSSRLLRAALVSPCDQNDAEVVVEQAASSAMMSFFSPTTSRSNTTNCMKSLMMIPELLEEEDSMDIENAAGILCGMKKSKSKLFVQESHHLRRSAFSLVSSSSTRSATKRRLFVQEQEEGAIGCLEQEKNQVQVLKKQSRYERVPPPFPQDQDYYNENEDCQSVASNSSSSSYNPVSKKTCDEEVVFVNCENHSGSASNNNTLPNRLAMPNDSQELNSLHCYVRSDLLEIFVVKDKSNSATTTSNHTRSSRRRQYHQEDDDRKTSGNTEDQAQLNDFNLTEPHDDSEEIEVQGKDHQDDDYVGGPTNIDELVSQDCQDQDQDQQDHGTISQRLFPGRVGLRCVHCTHVHRKRQKNGKASMSTFYPKSVADLYRSVCTWQRVHFRHCRYIPEDIRSKYWALKDSDRTRGKTKYWIKSAKELGLEDADKSHQRGGVQFASHVTRG